MMKIMTEITGVGRVSFLFFFSFFLSFFFFSIFRFAREREREREEDEVKDNYLIEEFLRARLEAR